MNEFDLKAAEWDKDPVHLNLSEAVSKKITELIPLKKDMIALEYGAGTGILSFLLKDQLKEILLMDNSTEMVKVIREKINASKIDNLRVLNFDLEHYNYECLTFDIIFTQMVLHHVTDISVVIRKFSEMLNPCGFLAIADLYEEDGSFHGEGFTGHKGFKPENISEILRMDHFINISYSKCYTISKKISESVTRNFDVFLLIGSLAK